MKLNDCWIYLNSIVYNYGFVAFSLIERKDSMSISFSEPNFKSFKYVLGRNQGESGSGPGGVGVRGRPGFGDGCRAN